MAESPAPNAVQSQKRPLEEPSSPTRPGDQPDAKRPALDKPAKVTATEEPISNELAAATTNDIKDIAEDVNQVQEIEAEDGATHSHLASTTTTRISPSSISPSSSQKVTSTPADESQWLHVRSIITSAEAATVIGKGGENVTLIRKHSGAKCTVSDYSRGQVERVLTVSGLVDAVAKAFGLIIRTLNNEPFEEASTPQSKTYPLRLLIPHIMSGSIIGKKGVRIREIQESSGARINASETPLPNSSERSLVILGVADAVHIATYWVGKTLSEQYMEKYGGTAASAYATRTGHPVVAVPGGLQVIPYNPQSAGGQFAHPDTYRRFNGSTYRTPSNPYGMHQSPTLSHASHHAPQHHTPQQHHHHPQHAPNGPNHVAHHSAAPSMSYGGPPHGHEHMPPQAAAYVHGGPPVPQAHVPPPQVAVPASPIAGGPLTQQIFIPNDMVGAIIGKGGSKINEIRHLSGSVIKINEPQENSNERLVTISGAPESNQVALYMLYSRLESEKHRA